MKDIVFFSGIEWYGQNRMPCHHLVERLSAKHRIFYINNFGALRDLDRHDLGRCVDKVSGIFKGRQNPHLEVSPELENVHVWQPWVIPTPRVSFIQCLNVKLLEGSLRRMYAQYAIEEPILWARLSTPIVREMASRLEHSLLVYQSIDKFPEHPRIAESLRERYRVSERALNEEADVVFCSARGLLEEKCVFNANAHFVPNGVTEAFAQVTVRSIPEMEVIHGPVVGFAGALGTATDIPWIVRLAQTMPDVSFVFLGTVDRSESLRELESLPNTYLPGLVPHADLISWFQYFDVGLMPYRLNEYQRYTFPSKMAEYLMAGLPIVSTRLPELSHYTDVVRLSDSVEGMATDVRDILANVTKEDPALLERRREVAHSLTWEAQIHTIERELETAAKGR